MYLRASRSGVACLIAVVGVGLIVFAFLLFALEMFITSHGILGLGGIVSLVLGGLLLTADNPPGFTVSPWLVFGLATVLAIMVAFVFANILRIRHMPAQVGIETMIGKLAVVRSPLNPTGYVFVNGEYWSAEAEGETVDKGDQVVITAINGFRLSVKKRNSEGAQT